MTSVSWRWRSALAGLALAAACDGATAAPEQGAFVGEWDGRLWIGDAHVTLLWGTRRGDELLVVGTHPRGADAFNTRERIAATVVFQGPGVYALAAGDVSFTELVGGDGVVARYAGAGSPAGLLRISRYDESTRAIVGELSFAARTDNPNASYGTSANLEDGRFRAVVIVQPVNTQAP